MFGKWKTRSGGKADITKKDEVNHQWLGTIECEYNGKLTQVPSAWDDNGNSLFNKDFDLIESVRTEENYGYIQDLQESNKK